MSDFIFRITPNVVLGSYTINRLGQQALEWAKRYMVIIDPVLGELKAQEKILQPLTDHKVEFFVFSELSEGTTTKTIQRALALAKEGHVEGIIAIGGTKTLCIGRAVGAYFNESRDFYDFADGAQPSEQSIPCICVPTTFAMPFVFSSEIPVTDSRNHQLKLMKIQNNVCKLVLVDPNLMLTLTENQKATINMEVMSMAAEAYLSQKANFFSDMFVEKGLELLSYATDGSPSLEITTPSEILLSQAGILISLATAASSPGLSTLLSLTINSRYRLSKSLVASILFPYTIEDTAHFKSARIEKLARLMRITKDEEGEAAIKAFTDNIRQRIAKAQLPARLKDLQLTISQISLAVEDAKEIDIVNKLPRSMTTDEIFDFIKRAY